MIQNENSQNKQNSMGKRKNFKDVSPENAYNVKAEVKKKKVYKNNV